MQRIRVGLMIAGTLIALNSLRTIGLAQTLSWEQSLSAQYPKGTVLNVLTTGVKGTALCNANASATFKDGKLHPPGFAQEMGLAAIRCSIQPIAPGTQVTLGEMKVYQKNNKVAFAVSQCFGGNCSMGVLKAQVDFEFPKGFLASASLEQILDPIHRVFSTVGGSNPPAPAAPVAPVVDSPAPPVIAPTVTPPTPGSLYVNSQNKADRIQLNPDNSFSLKEGGQSFTGSYSVAGGTLKLHIAQLGKDVDIVIQDNALVVNGAETWTLAPGPLYINSANSADRIQLNSDGAFTLQEGGQTFTGTYSVAGTTLKLHIAQLQKDVDIAIQGNQLIVNGNESWISAESGPGR